MQPTQMLFAGLGLMGTSLLKALKESGLCSAFGLDINEITIQKAISDGLIDKGAVLGEDETAIRELIGHSDFIVLGMYPEGILPFVHQYSNSFAPGTVIMDICGLKSHIVLEAQQILTEGVEYIGTHPMAGKEKSGYDFADPELFLGTNFLITPTEKNRPATVEAIREMAYRIGCGKITVLSPLEHDKMIAYTSQLPHVLALALLQSWHGDDSIVNFAGGSFRDATRVAEINTPLWTELFIHNHQELSKVIDNMTDELTMIKNMIEDQDFDALSSYLQQAGDRKRNWTKNKVRQSKGDHLE